MSGCSPRTTPVDNADKFEITFFDSVRPLVHTDTSRQFIKAFSEVLKTGSDKISCDSSGLIRFFRNDSLLYRAYFITEISSGFEGCEYVMEGNRGRRLTYKVGLYIDETLTKLMNQK